jgi:hypothetical protein
MEEGGKLRETSPLGSIVRQTRFIVGRRRRKVPVRELDCHTHEGYGAWLKATMPFVEKWIASKNMAECMPTACMSLRKLA